MLASSTALAQAPAPQAIQRGADLYERNCSPCHGARMQDPQGAFDLRKFPREDHARFVDTVTYGVRNMPPWDDVLKPEDIEALWAYVITEGKKPAR